MALAMGREPVSRDILFWYGIITCCRWAALWRRCEQWRRAWKGIH